MLEAAICSLIIKQSVLKVAEEWNYANEVADAVWLIEDLTCTTCSLRCFVIVVFPILHVVQYVHILLSLLIRVYSFYWLF